MNQESISNESIIQEQKGNDPNIHAHNKSTEELCGSQIQAFYQVRQKLTKFIEETSFFSFQQNDELSRYLMKLKNYGLDILNCEIDLIQIVDARLQRINRSKKILKNWNIQDKKLLNCIVLRLAKLKNISNIEATFKKQDWDYVASLIPGTSSDSCMFKWLSFHKTNIYQASWSQSQSEILKSLVSKFTNSGKSIRWKEVCKKLYLLSEESKTYRTPKQCKEHWNCKLNSNLRRELWNQEQDILLFKTIKQNSGLKKWVQMVKLFKGRTQNAVKNRYNLIIQKQKRFVGVQKQQLELVENYLQRCYVQKFNKIIEPDLQQQAALKIKQQQKKMKRARLLKKEQKSFLHNNSLQNKFPEIKLENIQPARQQEAEKEQKELEIRIEVKSVTSLLKQRGEGKIGDCPSFQKIQDQHNYDHRANDIEFDFMDLDS